MEAIAVIFDMDGVIIDSHSVAYNLLCATANAFGCPVAVDEVKSWGSLSSRQFWKKVKDDYGLPQDLSELMKSYDQDKENQMYKDMAPIKGVVQFLKQLQKNKIQTALATSATMKRMQAVMDLFELHPYFEAVVCDEEVTKSKPDPQIFLLASQKLSVKPNRCIVIEDSENGKVAAKSAGMKCIGFKGLPHVNENMDGCEMIITDFDDLKIDHFIQLLA